MIRYPQVKKFLDEQNNLMRDSSYGFIQRGVEEGYFRADLNYQMAVLQFDAMGEYIMQKELYRQYSIEEIFRNLVFVSLRGFVPTRASRPSTRCCSNKVNKKSSPLSRDDFFLMFSICHFCISAFFTLLHGAHARCGAQCRYNRRSNRCYHLHDKLQCLFLTHNL